MIHSQRPHRGKQLLGTVVTLLIVACFASDGWHRAGAAEDKSNWIVLFDGKSTDAWRGYKCEGFPKDAWEIDHDALKTIAGHGVDLITREKFESFELELEWKVGKEANSGIMYHVSEEFPETYWTGPEMQVVDDDNTEDGKNPLTSCGSLYDLIAPENKKINPWGHWNQSRILVDRNHVEYWMNGGKVVEYELDSPKLHELIAKTKFKDWPKFAREKTGYIALQNHGGETWYRNIRIRKL